MAYGARFLGTTGYTQVDGDTPAMVVHESGLWERPYVDEDPEDGSDVTEIDFVTPITSGAPLIAIRPENGAIYPNYEFAACARGLVKDGTDYVGFNLSWYYWNGNLDTHHVHWVAFRPIQDSDAISGGYGVNVWDTAGTLVWTSDKRVLNIERMYMLNNMHGWTSTNPIQPKSFTNYFFVYPTYYYKVGWLVEDRFQVQATGASPGIWRLAYDYNEIGHGTPELMTQLVEVSF